MGLFGRRKKNESAGVACMLDGRELQYAVRRYMDGNGNPQEEGLGRGGRINTANGHVILSCGGRDVFVNMDITSVECGELMALNGAIFSGYNELLGKRDTVIVYYKSRFSQ